MRGHSSLIAALDAAIEVTRKGDIRTLRLDKVKEGMDGLTQDFQLAVIELNYARDKTEMTSCVVEPIARQKKEKTLTPALKYALGSFIKACEAEGTESVHKDIWRSVFYAGHTADKADTKLKALNRSSKELVKLGILSVHNDIYSRTSRTCPGQSGISGQDIQTDGYGHPYKGCPSVR